MNGLIELKCRNAIENSDGKVLEILKTLPSSPFLFLPNPLQDDGPHILFIRNSIPEIRSVQEVSAANHVLQDILMLEDDHAVVNGLITIVDLKGLAHFVASSSNDSNDFEKMDYIQL
uniref:Uncharacterized protein n=1 Tax=Glossina palpalis gambiensis TaxID=67801 RepID=A0A1B0AU15_9MUSC